MRETQTIVALVAKESGLVPVRQFNLKPQRRFCDHRRLAIGERSAVAPLGPGT